MFDIKCARCGESVKNMKYYVKIDNLIGGIDFDIHVKTLSISHDNEEHDFCKTCRALILVRAIGLNQNG